MLRVNSDPYLELTIYQRFLPPLPSPRACRQDEHQAWRWFLDCSANH